jgi:hypothetical protein
VRKLEGPSRVDTQVINYLRRQWSVRLANAGSKARKPRSGKAGKAEAEQKDCDPVIHGHVSPCSWVDPQSEVDGGVVHMFRSKRDSVFIKADSLEGRRLSNFVPPAARESVAQSEVSVVSRRGRTRHQGLS